MDWIELKYMACFCECSSEQKDFQRKHISEIVSLTVVVLFSTVKSGLDPQ
jgi:hypothetical protein